MNSLDLTINQKEFYPQGKLRGTVSWKLDREPKNIEVRLFWYTRGKGNEDVLIVDCDTIETSRMQGEKAFQFDLPEAPYSFSGKLISLVWGIEVFANPSIECQRELFVLSPTKKEIYL